MARLISINDHSVAGAVSSNAGISNRSCQGNRDRNLQVGSNESLVLMMMFMRRMLVMQTLEAKLVFGPHIVISSTYNTPTARVKIRPSFRPSGSWSLTMTGMGQRMMMTSVAMLTAAMAT
jgi:hypothetical protein